MAPRSAYASCVRARPSNRAISPNQLTGSITASSASLPAELAAPMRHQQRHHVVRAEIRCGVGDSGDAERGEAPTEFGEVGVATLQRLGPTVAGTQPAVGVFGHSEQAQCRGIEDPQGAAAVLDANRNVGHHGVERGPIQLTGNGFVVTDRPDPSVGIRRGLRQCLC